MEMKANKQINEARKHIFMALKTRKPYSNRNIETTFGEIPNQRLTQKEAPNSASNYFILFTKEEAENGIKEAKNCMTAGTDYIFEASIRQHCSTSVSQQGKITDHGDTPISRHLTEGKQIQNLQITPGNCTRMQHFQNHHKTLNLQAIRYGQ